MFGEVLTAMITPFDEQGQVNYSEVERIADHLVNNGSDGIVLTGTTGESPTLTHDEERQIYQVVKKAVGSKTKLMAGTGSNDTATAIEATRAAEKLGMDGALLVVPYYNKPTQEGMYQHFKVIAENTSLPLMIYNIPGRTAVNMNTDTLMRLTEIKNYFSVKEASGNLEQIRDVITRVPKNFLVYSGDDGLTLDVLKMGGFGVVSVASHLVGKQIKQMIGLAKAGKTSEAEALNQKLQNVFKVLFIISNPSPLKAAMNLMGFKAGGVRLPLVMPNAAELAQIKTVLDDLGLTT